MADSVPSREEWMKAIRKVIFKAQNLGENVKVGLLYVYDDTSLIVNRYQFRILLF